MAKTLFWFQASFFRRKRRVLGKNMSQSKERNMKDEVCPECRTGKAVVRFRAPKRYSWGCSFFPDCYGPKAWQSIQVPEEQKRECDEEYKNFQAAQEETVSKKEKKRAPPPKGRASGHDKDNEGIDGNHDSLKGRKVARTDKRK